jgi:hypothetical protein
MQDSGFGVRSSRLTVQRLGSVFLGLRFKDLGHSGFNISKVYDLGHRVQGLGRLEGLGLWV